MDNLPAWALWIITAAVGLIGARFAPGQTDRPATPPRAVAAPGSSTSVGRASARRTCGTSAIVTQPYCRDQRWMI
jgi:hypothetical protein